MQTQTISPKTNPLDFGTHPLRHLLFWIIGSFLILGLLIAMAPGMGKGGIFLVFVVPLIFLLALQRSLVHLGNGITHGSNRRKLRKTRIQPELVEVGRYGDFIAFDTTNRKLFVLGHLFDFSDLHTTNYYTKGNFTWLEMHFNDGPAALVKFRAGTEERAAEIQRTIRKVVWNQQGGSA